MSCYAAGRSLPLPHICHATLLVVPVHFHTYVMLRCWTFSCTSTHICVKLCKYLSGVTGNVLNKLGQLCAWRKKKELFHETLGTQNYSFVVEKTLDFPILRRPLHGFLTTNLLKKNHVQITTVSDMFTVILWLSDVITDTASYRRWNLVSGWRYMTIS